MKKVIIFDMDGVILDSEKLYMDLNMEWFKKIGIKITVQEYQKWIGASAKKFWTYLKEKNSLAESTETYIMQEKELKHQMLANAFLAPMPGIVSLFGLLKQNGFTLAIASSGLRKNINLILSKLAIDEYFDLIVSGEQVVRGKPEPDIFVSVAEHYQVIPNTCIVVEDSTNGVTAAKAAGMYCIGFYNPNSGNQDLSKADMVIKTFTDESLIKLITDKMAS
ncbi:MAG: HAD family hydrolase [Chitinophagaceae bacterium]|nr:HAD family hydrolase [Chitinophagaceae bacterium]